VHRVIVSAIADRGGFTFVRLAPVHVAEDYNAVRFCGAALRLVVKVNETENFAVYCSHGDWVRDPGQHEG
jgi:hypothetical protein